MGIDGITSQVTSVLHTVTSKQAEPGVLDSVQPPPQSSEIPEPDIAESEAGDDEGAKGVIRNILNGHYKGVSDIRLRINHYEELAALENKQLTGVAEGEVEDILAIVQAGVGQIIGLSEPLVAEMASEDKSEAESSSETVTVSGLQDEFVDTINGITEEFQSAETPSVDNLVSGIENAFADFIASLQDLLVPPPPVVVDGEADQGSTEEETLIIGQEDSQASQSDETTSTETQESALAETEPLIDEEPEPPLVEDPVPPEPEGPDYQDFIEELSSDFAAAMAALIESLNTTGVLPELSGPIGNGVAYEKFLAIYNQMRTGETVEDDTDNAEDVNIIA